MLLAGWHDGILALSSLNGCGEHDVPERRCMSRRINKLPSIQVGVL